MQFTNQSLRLLILVLALAFAGCGGGGGNDGDPQDSEKADLAIQTDTGNTFFWTPGNLYVARVHNQGLSDAPAFEVLVTFTTFTGDVTVPFSVGPLAAGATSAPLSAPLPEGSTTSQYMIQVDVTNVVDESIESNNEATEEALF